MTIVQSVGPNLLDDVASLLTPTFGPQMIWCDWLPPEPDIAIGIFQEPGKAPMRSQETLAAPVAQPELQVLVRGAPDAAQDARLMAQGILESLGAITNTPIGANFYLGFVPMHEPYLLGRDQLNRPMYAVTFSVMSRRLVAPF